MQAGTSRVTPRIPQRTITLSCPRCYLLVELLCESVEVGTISKQLATTLIRQALLSGYGSLGGSVGFKVLTLDRYGAIDRAAVILEVNRSDEGKMYATLATTKVQLQTGSVRFEVLRSSPFLLSLGADSRSWASRLPFPL